MLLNLTDKELERHVEFVMPWTLKAKISNVVRGWGSLIGEDEPRMLKDKVNSNLIVHTKNSLGYM